MDILRKNLGADLYEISELDQPLAELPTAGDQVRTHFTKINPHRASSSTLSAPAPSTLKRQPIEQENLLPEQEPKRRLPPRPIPARPSQRLSHLKQEVS
jgi:hypothetical protein